MKALAVALALLLISTAARADIAEVFRLYRGQSSERTFVKTLIGGIADGLDAANQNLQESGKPKLYCVPEAVNLTNDQLIEILRIWVDAYRAKSPRIETGPPALGLLYAMQNAFPCR